MKILQLFEMPGGDVRGWASHVRGLSKLFQMRGPNQYGTDPSHSLFLGFRATKVSSLSNRIA